MSLLDYFYFKDPLVKSIFLVLFLSLSVGLIMLYGFFTNYGVHLEIDSKVDSLTRTEVLRDTSSSGFTPLSGSGGGGLIGVQSVPPAYVAGCYALLGGGVYTPTVVNFTTTWDTSLISAGSSGGSQLSLPLDSAGVYNFVVNWGDGAVGNVTSWDDPDKNHTYGLAGIYNVTINGTFEGFRFNNGGDRLKLLDIVNFGGMSLGNSGSYFYGAANMQISATDAPDLSSTTTLGGIFRDATSFNSSIDHWNVSNVNNFANIFYGATSFNQPLNNWDVSSGTGFQLIFYQATSFNQPLNNWNMSSAQFIIGMFNTAPSFNQDISSWDTSSVTHMQVLFNGASSFNQPLNSWNVSSVQFANAVFRYATSFNQPLNNWDTSSMTQVSGFFNDAILFNQDISSWNTSSITIMSQMFDNASSFDQDLSGWDVDQVTSCSQFNTSISGNWSGAEQPNFTSCTP